MTPKEKRLVAAVPLMRCGNRAEFNQRLQWLSEGMLRNHLEHVANYTPDQSEIDAYKRFKEENNKELRHELPSLPQTCSAAAICR